MAGEYSRELSVKVIAGQCRLVELGYRQGGAAGYGLRRVLIDEHGNPKGELSRGEQKSLQTDRVILAPGPEEEQRIVQRMYEMFVREGRPEREIAEVLNAEGHRTDLDRPWTRATVHQVLTNEKYIGNNVFNKVSFKLKLRRVVNPREMWIRAEGTYPAIVDEALFLRAREIVDARSRHFSDEELLDALRAILQRQGMLSGLIIDEEDDLPSSSAYRAVQQRLPTFVLEFLLARFCASDDPAEIDAGMEAVLATLQDNYVRPDDEFARINLSYFGANGEEIVVLCPESKDALATQQPERRRLNEDETEDTTKLRAARPDPAKSEPSAAPVQPSVDEARVEAATAEPQEQHFTILYGDTGHSYESIMGPYIRGAKAVTIEDPYIRLPR